MVGVTIVIIVIFVVVWIVSNVIRAQQDAAQAAARRRSSGRNDAGAARAPEKTTSSDIDRFLQEIDRLRKKDGQGQQTSRAGGESPPSAAAERTQQRPRTQPQQKRTPSRARPSERKTSAPLPPPKPLPPVKSSTAPLVPELDTGRTEAPPAPAATPVELKYPAVQTSTKPSAPSRPARPGQSGTPMSSSLEIIHALLKNGQGAATAVLLHEIFSKPKCQRRTGLA